jgi:selenide,water dikinase
MGTVHPKKVFDNTKGRAEDSIVLTKPIGTGVISTGIRAGVHDEKAVPEFTASMAALNKRAGELMLEHGASTATDITGFGLIGHLSEVLIASELKARLHSGRVPYFAEALRLAQAGSIAGGTRANMRTYLSLVQWAPEVPENHRVLMNDAQTSGGLAIFIQEAKRDALLKALQAEGITAAYIGDVIQAGVGEGIRLVIEL